MYHLNPVLTLSNIIMLDSSRRSVLETAAPATNIPQGQQDPHLPNGLNPPARQNPGQPLQEGDPGTQMVYPIVVTHLGAEEFTFSHRLDRPMVPLEGKTDSQIDFSIYISDL
jgi:hypothetical protein